MQKIIEGIIIGLVLGAISVSAKAIIDVARLDVDTKNQKELLIEVRSDVKAIREHLIGR